MPAFDQLSVKTTASGDKNGPVVITIGLPAGSSLVAYLAHSSVQADGSLGECELHLASGRVQLDRIGALQANVAAGEVTIGHIAGRASIDGAAFALRISEAGDTVKLSSSGGQTWIGHASADLDLSSGHGGLDIDRADADSKRGPVRNSVPPREDPGPSDHKVTVHARTRYGDIVIQPAAN